MPLSILIPMVVIGIAGIAVKVQAIDDHVRHEFFPGPEGIVVVGRFALTVLFDLGGRRLERRHQGVEIGKQITLHAQGMQLTHAFGDQVAVGAANPG